MLKIFCIIPSRVGSTRLPRKPLLPIAGKPMIQLVYENAVSCNLFHKVIVATDSLEISKVITDIKGNVAMTSANLATGSDRVAAVAATCSDADIIVNLQGDQPFVRPEMLEQLLQPYLQHRSGEIPPMATLASNLDYKDLINPGAVKVITDLNYNAIYFSRAPIPYIRNQSLEKLPVYHHIGLYAFTRDFLLKFTTLAPTPLELIESLEQLRAIEHGCKIKVSLTSCKSLEINTLEDYTLAKNFVMA